MTGEEAVNRLRPFVGRGVYGLGAGTSWRNPTPFSTANRCDCSAAVLWAWKQERHDENFPEYEGDINVDSALMDAGLIPGGKGKQRYFKPVALTDARVGDIVMFPSVRASELDIASVPAATRIRIGHTGLVAAIHGPTVADWEVLECSASGKYAIKLGPDYNFHIHNMRRVVTYNGRIFASDKWQTRVVRYVGPGSQL